MRIVIMIGGIAALIAIGCQSESGLPDGQGRELGYDNVTVRHGDGYRGWPEHSPFDVIVVAAAPDHIPQPLVDQLAKGGANGDPRRPPVPRAAVDRKVGRR